MRSSNDYRGRYFSTKGLSVLCFSAILAIIVLRAESKDLPKMLDVIMSSHVLTIVLAAVLLVVLMGAVLVIKLQQKTHEKEIFRLTKERDKLQNELLERSEAQHGK